MIKIVALTAALAAGLVSGAYAQNSGPAAQTDNMNICVCAPSSRAVMSSIMR
jgi:hypothetical protein